MGFLNYFSWLSDTVTQDFQALSWPGLTNSKVSAGDRNSLSIWHLAKRPFFPQIKLTKTTKLLDFLVLRIPPEQYLIVRFLIAHAYKITNCDDRLDFKSWQRQEGMSNVPCIIPSLDRSALNRFIHIYSTKITFEVHIYPHMYINTHRKIKSSHLDFPTTLTSRHVSLKTYYQLHVHRIKEICWQNTVWGDK